MKLSILFLIYFFVNVRGQRIAGGEPTTIGQYPFATSLLTNTGSTNNAYVHACGGSVLTVNAILSAASCFYSTAGVVDQPSAWRARVASSSAVSGGTIHLVKEITPHPDFSFTTKNNDIAVLKVTVNFNLRPNLVEVARIAGGAYTFGTNQPIVAIGWGRASEQASGHAEQLQRVQFWTINQQTCANRYNALGFTVTDNMVCVGWLDVGIRGQCPDDAGSPILDNDGGVVGVFSWAEGCANPWYPDINTRIAPYTNWIIATATA